MEAAKHSSVDHRDLNLRQIIELSPVLIHTARPDGYLDFFNRTWTDFVGQPLEKLLGWRWTAFIHPEDAEGFVKTMRESFAKGEPFEETSRVRRADGVYRWMLHRKVPRRDEVGNVIKWFGSSIDIEERARAEEERQTSAQLLQRNEFYLAEAQRLGHMGSWVFDPSGVFDYWSRELFHIYGLDPEEHAPTVNEYLARVHPHDREFMASLIKQMVAEGVGCDVTKRIVRPDGELRHIRCVGAPVVENGTLKRIIGNAIDVTEHEILTQELRRREAYLAEAQRLSHTGSFGWRPGRGEHVWSNETYRIFEYDLAAKVTLEMIVERVHPEDRNLVLELVERASISGTAINCEYRLLFPDNRIKYVRVLASPLGTVSDELEFAGAVIDITETKETERSLQMREHELIGIIETIPSMLWSASSAGEPTHLSKRVLEYFGASLGEFANRGWENFIHPDDREETAKAFARAIDTGESYSAIHRLRRADREYRWHHARGEPLRDPQGAVIQWYGLSIDIDERKRAEDHLRDTRIKLSRASKIATVAELSASTAHELNQPLMAVLGNAQAAKRWFAADPPNLIEANASIDRILGDIRSADETMEHIRALFKNEPYEKSDENVLDIIRESLRLVHEDPNKREVQIDWSIEDSLPSIYVDRIQTQQVFINLISNAIEATDGGANTAKILLRAFVTQKHEVVVQVIDNGMGLEDTERIFDAFVTTKEKGMGIGLAVSRSIVEAHGGRIWAENNPDRVGATFNVALPVSPHT